MDIAIQYAQHMRTFLETLQSTHNANVMLQTGRRFERVLVNGQTRFFVDKNTWEIFGAKSNFQYNPRRQYGAIDTVEQFDWIKLMPIPNSPIEANWLARELNIQKAYKPRGRPKKQTVQGGN
jgi:hypothetical protein